MKKIVLSIAFGIFSILSINAQEFGAKVGLNLADVNYSGDADEIVDTKMRMGLQVGIVAEFEISEQFSFQPELMYSMQGYKQEYKTTFAGTIVVLDGVLKLDYINIPLMAKYYVAEGFSIQAGPQVGFLIAANSEYTSETSFGGEVISKTENRDVKDETKNIDFGLNFGVGYKMDNGLFIDARYNLGLFDIADERGDNDDAKSTNGVLNFAIGYSFN